MTNTNKLKGALASAGYTQQSMAKELGISTATFCNKLNNRTEFKASEMFILEEKLNIKDLAEIFYTQTVN